MTSDEEKVRAVWANVRIHEQGCVKEAPNQWHGFVMVDIGNGIGHGREVMIASGTRAKRWAAAAAFTDERLEEIRQLREEIAWIKQASYAGDDSFSQSWGYDARENCTRTIRHCRASRTLDRLEAILAEKTAGIRPEAL